MVEFFDKNTKVMYNKETLDYICNLLNISWITVHKWKVDKSIECGRDINYYLKDVKEKPLTIVYTHTQLVGWPENYSGDCIKYDVIRKEFFI